MTHKYICAPIVITTLNRYEHLKKCIDSLKKCTLASETDLYISIDYPPSEKYFEGYYQILEYVDGGIEGFSKVHIYKQNHNLGPGKNSTFVEEEALKTFDNYIYTEDDNVFSPSFLMYINEMLYAYKDNDSIFAINAYSYPIDWDCGDNIIIKENLFCSAWGYGMTKKQFYDKYLFTRETVSEFLKDFKNAIKLFKVNKHVFNNAVYIAANKHYLANLEYDKLRYIDTVMGIIPFMTGKYILMPCLSRVRNVGHDGTGVNCDTLGKLDNIYDNQRIDELDIFSFDDCKVIEPTESHMKQLSKFFPKTSRQMLKCWILWFLYVKLKLKK